MTTTTLSWPRLLTLALLGAIAATMGDAIHALTGTLSYPEPRIGLQAPWVFPGFLVAFLAMGIAYWQLAPLFGQRSQESRQAGSPRALVETLSAFMAIYFLSGFGNASPTLLVVIFYGLFFLRWLFTYDRAWLLFLAVLMAVGGMFVEGLLSAFDLVRYGHYDIFYVPWWLGGLYMHGAFALREGMRHFSYR